MKNLILFLLMSFAFCACHSEEIQPAEKGEVYNEENPLVGYWINGDFEEETQIFTRASGFDPEKTGFAFFENGKLVERGYSGWCATPPVSFTDYKGQWSINEENHLILNTTHWGGERIIAFEIVAVDKDTLQLKYISE